MAEKENSKAPHPSQLDKVKEITDKLEAGIHELMESAKFKEYLKCLSKFHNYSLVNTILIAMQKPDATLVAGYTAWKNQFGRQVQKGETGIRILAPTPYKKKVEVALVDPSTGQARMNPDGTKATELKEIMVPAFKVVNVFDVSQTDGRPIPSIGVNELTGDVRQYDMFLEALKRTCPVPIGFEQIDSGAKGYYHTVDHRIALQEGMSQIQTIKTLIHEMTHEHLHSKDPKELPPEEPRLTKNAKEVEAESVAYTVAQHYGIETSDYSFAYIAGWSAGKDTPELKASLDRIRMAADELITGIDAQLQILQKEMGLDVQEAPQPELPVPGLQENGFYRYYSTQRPVDIGTFPKPPNNKPVEIHNYDADSRIPVENGMIQAWGYIEYPKPLTEKQVSDYELRPAPARFTEKEVRESQKHDIGSGEQDIQKEKKSVLKNLTAKKPEDKGTPTKGTNASRKTRKPKEETR